MLHVQQIIAIHTADKFKQAVSAHFPSVLFNTQSVESLMFFFILPSVSTSRLIARYVFQRLAASFAKHKALLPSYRLPPLLPSPRSAPPSVLAPEPGGGGGTPP